MKRCWLLLSLVPVFAYGVTTTLEYEDSREAASRTAISNEIASAVGSVDVGVTSVNSKTGAVVLAAADVGAIPSTGGKHQTSPGCVTDYLASGAIGGARVIASSASPEYDYTAYARMGIAVRRLGGSTKNFLYDDSENGIVRRGDVAALVPPTDFTEVKSVYSNNGVYRLRQNGATEAFGYDIQGAIYQEIVRQNIGKKLPFVLAVTTKEENPDKALIQIDQYWLDKALELVKNNCAYFDQIKKGQLPAVGCGHCATCRKDLKVKGVVSYETLYGKVREEYNED